MIRLIATRGEWKSNFNDILAQPEDLKAAADS